MSIYGEGVSHEATELMLFIENDADLYRRQTKPIEKNLITKMARGVYDKAKAEKLWGYLAESGAKKYAKEFGIAGEWHKTFPVSARKEVARILNEGFMVEASLGNYNSYLPKKYAGWKPAPMAGGKRRHGRKGRAAKKPTAKMKLGRGVSYNRQSGWFEASQLGGESTLKMVRELNSMLRK